MAIRSRWIFQRPRTRTMLFFSSVLALLSLVVILYPMSMKTTVDERTFETQSVVFKGRRREYYILNRNFFDFLSRTSMECLIQVEPADELSEEAIVRTKLIDNGSSQDDEQSVEIDTVKADVTNIPTSTNTEDSSDKYILVYRHFEQLSKTTENLIQLAAVAKRWGRNVVLPYVKNSRFFLGPEFHTYPLDIYFNVTSINILLHANGYSPLVRLKTFNQKCNYAKFGIKTTLIHFLYDDIHRGNTKLWFGLNDRELREIVENSLSSGWTECDFMKRHLGVSKSINGIQIGRQLCVNPEVVRTEQAFKETILQEDKCTIFMEWRGFGKQRIHFHPVMLPFFNPAELKHRISPSDLIDQEVTTFLQSKLSSKYISVHLRTESLFVANLYKKLQSCIDHVVHLLSILRSLRGVDTVFLATDLTDFGSDLFERKKFYITNETGEHLMRRQDIAAIHTHLAHRMNAVTYTPTRKPFSKDKGLVSLVEMNILKRGIDIITLGSGTFHSWMVSVFRQRQSEIERRGYTISEVCRNAIGAPLR
ncbi:uncharacterized protein LOC114524743 [Dendronephthya gigantea]|uniref:uncharacterized protein LOC114524743 n=1 Tax=Dendronephthya gigantea TaxID=151771 RepID=UPI00106D87CD|nr:uncharacterized protein LOC114524743 [Dendronephthya gigantea]